MAARATRCPHCQTSFRVTEAQLATARGLVRCGACLEVFDARENWVEPLPVEDDQALKPEPSEAANTAPTDRIDDATEDNTGTAATDTDQVWEDESSEDDFTDSSPMETPSETDVDEARQEKEASEPEFSYRDDEDETEPHGTHFSAYDSDDDPENTAPPGDDPSLNTDNDSDDAFEELVSQRRQQIRIDRRQLLWSALSVVALLALAAQIIHANFNELAQSAYRDRLAATCRVINWLAQGEHCTLPPPQNLARIESRGLNVMSHPEYGNSLLIDALIINTATFSQPFPAVELAFTNERGAVVAARRFQPAEYLHGELAGVAMMPVGQSVRIQISILDPGSTAINYRMQFSPAQAAM